MTYKEQKPEGYNLGALAGRAFERERIIALLPDFCHNLPNGDLAENLIALIKGEQDEPQR